MLRVFDERLGWDVFAIFTISNSNTVFYHSNTFTNGINKVDFWN